MHFLLYLCLMFDFRLEIFVEPSFASHKLVNIQVPFIYKAHRISFNVPIVMDLMHV